MQFYICWSDCLEFFAFSYQKFIYHLSQVHCLLCVVATGQAQTMPVPSALLTVCSSNRKCCRHNKCSCPTCTSSKLACMPITSWGGVACPLPGHRSKALISTVTGPASGRCLLLYTVVTATSFQHMLPCILSSASAQSVTILFEAQIHLQ